MATKKTDTKKKTGKTPVKKGNPFAKGKGKADSSTKPTAKRAGAAPKAIRASAQKKELPTLKQVLALLKTKTVSVVATELGVSRLTMYRRFPEIKGVSPRGPRAQG